MNRSLMVFGLLVWAVAISILPLDAGADTVQLDYTVSDIESWDHQGDTDNFRDVLDLGSGFTSFRVIAIGWDLELEAVDPSWLEELQVSFGDGSSVSLTLTPAAGDEFPGTANYSSGGMIDLIGLNLDWTQTSSLLHLEFHESFDDTPNSIDGFWRSGLISFTVQRIPEPLLFGFLATGLVTAVASRRRRLA